MKHKLNILLIFTAAICYSQTKPLMSMKKLFAEPLYYLRNDTLFTLDTDNNMLICKDSTAVYRLKIFAGNETTFKEYPGNRHMTPYSDITLIIKRAYSLPNLQYLDLNFLQLWKFPKEILQLDNVQVLKMEGMSYDDRTERIYHSDTVPAALWHMKNLKHLSIYVNYDEAGKPFLPYLNDSDDDPKTRQYIPDDVKFKVARYIKIHNDQRIDNKIQNAWKNSRKEEQAKKNYKDPNTYPYALKRLEKIFGDSFWTICECE